jgi:hypothetical protein
MRTFAQIQFPDLGTAVVDEPRGGDKRCHGCDRDDVPFSPLQHAREKRADEHKMRD